MTDHPRHSGHSDAFAVALTTVAGRTTNGAHGLHWQFTLEPHAPAATAIMAERVARTIAEAEAMRTQAVFFVARSYNAERVLTALHVLREGNPLLTSRSIVPVTVVRGTGQHGMVH